MSRASDIRIARAYDDLGDIEGARLLVDRVWPRGVSRDEIDLDDWVRDVAPTSGLRKWFGHDPRKWQEFRSRYRKELDANEAAVERCLEWCRKGPVVLLFGARDREHNQAAVLRDYLHEALEGSKRG